MTERTITAKEIARAVKTAVDESLPEFESELDRYLKQALRLQRRKFAEAVYQNAAEQLGVNTSPSAGRMIHSRAVTNILDEVSLQHGITREILTGKSDRIGLAPARQEVMTRLRDELELSLPRIGQIMGRRDHTTVMYAIDKYRETQEIAAYEAAQ